MARGGGNVRVKFTADTSGLERGTKKAESSLSKVNSVGSRAFGGLKAGALGAGAAVGGVAVMALKESVEAAVESEKAQARLKSQLGALGISYKQYAGNIDAAVQKQSLLSGFDDEDLTDSFTNIVRVTGDVNKALELNQTAMDLARGKQIDVAKAGELISKVAGGNVGVLRRYGIQIDKGATAQEALAAVQQKFGGQAKEYGKSTAGSLARANVAYENLKETIGGALAPVVAKAADALANFIRGLQGGSGAGGKVGAVIKGILPDLKGMFTSLGQVGKALWPILKTLSPAILGTIKGSLQAVSGAFKVLAGVLTGDMSLAGEGLKGIFRGIVTSMIGQLRTAAAPMVGAARGLGLAITNPFTTSWRKIKQTFQDGVGNLKSRLRNAVAPIREIAHRIGAAVLSGVRSMGRVVSYVRGRIDAVVDTIRGRIAGAKNAAGRVGKGIIDGFDKVRDIVKKVKDAVGDAVTAVKDKVSDAGTAALAVGQKMVDVFSGLGGAIKTAIINGLEGLAGEIAQKIKGAIGAALKAIGNVKNKIKRKIPGIGGASASTSGVGIGGGAGVSANAADAGGIGMDAGISAAGTGGGGDGPISMSTTGSAAKKKKKKKKKNAAGPSDGWNLKIQKKQARWYDKQIATAKTESKKVIAISIAIEGFTEILGEYKGVERRYPATLGFLQGKIKQYQTMLDGILAKKPAGPPPPEDSDNDGKNDVTGDLPTVWKAAQAGIALAELTPDTADDTAAKNTALGLANTYLNTAKSKNDYDAIVQWAAEVKQLTDAVQENTQSQQVTNELLAQQLAESKASYNVSQAQSSTITAALLDIISGGIGGTIGLGFQTPAYAGKVASY